MKMPNFASRYQPGAESFVNDSQLACELSWATLGLLIAMAKNSIDTPPIIFLICFPVIFMKQYGLKHSPVPGPGEHSPHRRKAIGPSYDWNGPITKMQWYWRFPWRWSFGVPGG